MLAHRAYAIVLLVICVGCGGATTTPAPAPAPPCSANTSDCEQCVHSVLARSDFGDVVFRGVDNTVTLLGSGVPNECVTAVSDNGVVTKNDSGFVLAAPTGDALKLTLTSAGDGCPSLGRAFDFRVMALPDPTPFFAGRSYADRRVKKSGLTAAQSVVARLPQSVVGRAKFTVTQFTLTTFVGGTPITTSSNSHLVTGAMKTLLGKTKPGSMVWVHDIVATGSDSSTRSLGALSLKVF